MQKVVDLNPLLDYYKNLKEVLDRIYPIEITWENALEVPIDLDLKHPDWVKAHFPLVLLFHRPKAGKLRETKSIKVVYQNSFNVLSQVVWTADDFGIHYRKNSHKGFKDIVAAIPAKWEDRNHTYNDLQKPLKYKNFEEFSMLHDPTNIELKAMCSVLDENYNCDSVGQLRFFNY